MSEIRLFGGRAQAAGRLLVLSAEVEGASSTHRHFAADSSAPMPARACVASCSPCRAESYAGFSSSTVANHSREHHVEYNDVVVSLDDLAKAVRSGVGAGALDQEGKRLQVVAQRPTDLLSSSTIKTLVGVKDVSDIDEVRGRSCVGCPNTV